MQLRKKKKLKTREKSLLLILSTQCQRNLMVNDLNKKRNARKIKKKKKIRDYYEQHGSEKWFLRVVIQVTIHCALD